MKINKLVGEKVVVFFINDLRLEGKIEAIDEEGFGFVTSKKASYVSFSDVRKIKQIPTLEEVDF